MFVVTCPRCRAEVTLAARRLTLWSAAAADTDTDRTTPGEVLFTCLACHGTVTAPVGPAAVAALAGVTRSGR